MLTFNEANNIVEKEFKSIRLKTEVVSLLDSLNRILAEDIVSDISIPPFNNSAYDGYAINYSEEITKWKLVGEVSAGNFIEYKTGENICVRIMTGAKIPNGFDTIIPLEDVDCKENIISLHKEIDIVKGQNLRYQGEDLAKGENAIPKNTLLTEKYYSLLASCGKANVKVYKKLNIAVLGTGDELIEIDEIPVNDKIRSSNTYSLLASIEAINMNGINWSYVKDDKLLIKDILNRILNSEIDILLTTGGVSVGKYDYLKEILEELGMITKFWKVNVKPGKPLLFGVCNQNTEPILVFGLPGNPVSSFVSFNVFVRPQILKLYGLVNKNIKAKLIEPITKKDNKRYFTRGHVYFNDDNLFYEVKQIGSQSSGNLVGVSKANCLIVLDEEKNIFEKEDILECILI